MQTHIAWGRAAGGSIAAQVAQIAAAFAWVAIYSYTIHPGQPLATYEAYAQTSGPWVSLFAGFPIFYAASRWIAGSLHSALALFAIFLFMDVALVVAMGAAISELPFALFAANFVTKLAACALGGRHAGSRADKARTEIGTA